MQSTSNDHIAETKAGPVGQITEDAALVAMAAVCRSAKGDLWRSTVREMCMTPAEGLIGATIQAEVLENILPWADCEGWGEETGELKLTVIWSIWRVLSKITGMKTDQCLGGMLPCYDPLEPLLHPNTRPAVAGISAGAQP